MTVGNRNRRTPCPKHAARKPRILSSIKSWRPRDRTQHRNSPKTDTDKSGRVRGCTPCKSFYLFFPYRGLAVG
ncbi:hypothetical protein [Pandoravirus japonicus]|uniref:Uncharacterized protein n=1 Tax=Pandoravirus japonicus TaxID=2823154 RepID=A0A811BL83_9VIRU|nr:hypothetical protein [Pandoravirus japonicus]